MFAFVPSGSLPAFAPACSLYSDHSSAYHRQSPRTFSNAYTKEQLCADLAAREQQQRRRSLHDRIPLEDHAELRLRAQEEQRHQRELSLLSALRAEDEERQRLERVARLRAQQGRAYRVAVADAQARVYSAAARQEQEALAHRRHAEAVAHKRELIRQEHERALLLERERRQSALMVLLDTKDRAVQASAHRTQVEEARRAEMRHVAEVIRRVRSEPVNGTPTAAEDVTRQPRRMRLMNHADAQDWLSGYFRISPNHVPPAAAAPSPPEPETDANGQDKAWEEPDHIYEPIPLSDRLRDRLRTEPDGDVRATAHALLDRLSRAAPPPAPAVAAPAVAAPQVKSASATRSTAAPAPAPSLPQERGADLKRTPALSPAVAAKILAVYRAHRARRTALAALSSIATSFDALAASFVFPAHLDFTPPHPASPASDAASDAGASRTPALAYSPANAALRAHEHALAALLVRLDGVESGGDARVRAARKELVRRVEAALEEMDRMVEERRAAAEAEADVRERHNAASDDPTEALAVETSVTPEALTEEADVPEAAFDASEVTSQPGAPAVSALADSVAVLDAAPETDGLEVVGTDISDSTAPDVELGSDGVAAVPAIVVTTTDEAEPQNIADTLSSVADDMPLQAGVLPSAEASTTPIISADGAISPTAPLVSSMDDEEAPDASVAVTSAKDSPAGVSAPKPLSLSDLADSSSTVRPDPALSDAGSDVASDFDLESDDSEPVDTFLLPASSPASPAQKPRALATESDDEPVLVDREHPGEEGWSEVEA